MTAMNITLKQIRALVAVAQTGSFTQAAGRLHLTQSALSVLIRELENELGIRLFDRTTRSVRLTDAGREFYPVAERMLADLQNAVVNSRELAAQRRGRVAVAATPLFSATLLPRGIAEYREQHPGVEVVLRDSLAGQVQRMVRDGDVDCGIATCTRGESEIVVESLMADTLILACPKGHVLGKKAHVTWRDLAGFPFIALSPDNSVGQIIDRVLAAADIIVPRAYEVSFLSTVVGLVAAGLGIAVLPSYACTTMRLYDIQTRRLTEPTVERPMSLLTSKDRSLSPAAESFREFILGYAKKMETELFHPNRARIGDADDDASHG